jgi:hypothetical protein
MNDGVLSVKVNAYGTPNGGFIERTFIEIEPFEYNSSKHRWIQRILFALGLWKIALSNTEFFREVKQSSGGSVLIPRPGYYIVYLNAKSGRYVAVEQISQAEEKLRRPERQVYLGSVKIPKSSKLSVPR